MYFLVVWLLTTFKRIDLISFASAPSPLHFHSEYTIRYIYFRIRIRSLSTPLHRRKHMVEDMVKVKSDPIRSSYIPTHRSLIFPGFKRPQIWIFFMAMAMVMAMIVLEMCGSYDGEGQESGRAAAERSCSRSGQPHRSCPGRWNHPARRLHRATTSLRCPPITRRGKQPIAGRGRWANCKCFLFLRETSAAFVFLQSFILGYRMGMLLIGLRDRPMRSWVWCPLSDQPTF
jgi:hypothetical protein